MADKDGEPAREEKSPEKAPERSKAVKAQPQMSFVVRVLLDWSGETHGKLLLMAPGYDRSGTIGFRCVSDAS